ncbi:DUF3861 domain-containing protein [Brenneria roseae subsp. americana]|uniref:DUF3861 domain-containing protein n=1 Tax=Brenneria roseae subsp. americana TaxID=1508507 RepID=A0A2U1TXJ9_9GAMM|nr:DUF3861 domain-containing protein [Brenneria roseae]PWC14104.1 DUF3861 domain-containing protein [Brenneria roseae subsp. americana]PWC22308.1 DUF3861 domain-containing protein [Brenneria roseae subsp. roseae]
MKQHQYRITIEHLADKNGVPPVEDKQLQFEVGNHDDIFAIVERMRQRSDFDEAAATAFAVGLKLFGEVMMTHRNHPLFAEFSPHFRDFMQALKK